MDIEKKSSRKQRRNYTSEKKALILQRFRNSGLSKVAFCHKEGIAVGNLRRWLKQEDSTSGIVPIKLNEQTDSSADYVEVEMCSGTKVKLPLPSNQREKLTLLREILKAC